MTQRPLAHVRQNSMGEWERPKYAYGRKDHTEGLGMAEGNPVALFRGKEIRKILHKDEWWFSVADVVAALTDTVDSRQYIKKIRQRDSALDAEWGTICTPLELIAPDGKRRETNCANTEGVFRIIQSMRSIHIREELTSEWKTAGSRRIATMPS
jgi:hypothetical protein